MGKVKGMELRAIDELGKQLEKFKVVWIGNLAFGETGTATTEKAFLELYDKQLQAENEKLKEQIAVIYDEAQAENVTLMSKNEQSQAEIERLKKENRWIPVSERLPEVYKDIVCFRSKTVMVWSGREMLGVELAWYDRDKGWCYCQGELGYGDFITLWKPITFPNQALRTES